MYISVYKLVEALDLKLNTFFKIINDCGYSSFIYINREQLQELIKCIKTKHKHYRKQLLAVKLESFLSSKEIQK